MVIEIKSIVSVVTMVPFSFSADGHGNNYFMIEQVGLDVVDTDT